MYRNILREKIKICVVSGLKKSALKYNVTVDHILNNFFQFMKIERKEILETICREIRIEFPDFDYDSTKFVEVFLNHGTRLSKTELAKFLEKSTWFCDCLANEKLKKFGRLYQSRSKIRGLKNTYQTKKDESDFGKLFVKLLDKELDYFIGFENRLSKRPKSGSFNKRMNGLKTHFVEAYGYSFHIHYNYQNSAIFEAKLIYGRKKPKFYLHDILVSFQKMFDVMECVESVELMAGGLLIKFVEEKQVKPQEIVQKNPLIEKIEEIKDSLKHKTNAYELTKKHLADLESQISEIENDLEILCKAANILNKQANS